MVRDLWSDHPMQQVDKSAPLPKPLGKPREEVIPAPPRDGTNSLEEDKYGRTSSGRSKRERKPVDYKCHLGDKQIPPGVRRLASKRRKYKQRMFDVSRSSAARLLYPDHDRKGTKDEVSRILLILG